MFNISHFFDAFFASAVQKAAEEEQRERAEHVDRMLEEYGREKEREQQFFQQLEEDHEQEKEQASRNWYDNEREQLEWEMQNADLYGYDKEDIQDRMDWLDEQQEKGSW